MADPRYSFFPVHLWVYNHPFLGISDQVEFFLLTMRQAGYPTTVSSQPRRDALNVVIENFSGATRDILIDYCESAGKKVAVIMTEHMDFLGDQIYFYRRKLFEGASDGACHVEYMHPVTRQRRVGNLLECLQHIRCFFTLGDLPQLQNINEMMPGVPVRSLPFPKLPVNLTSPMQGQEQASYDVVFTGFDTPYRRQLLKAVSKELALLRPPKFVSRRVRNQINRRGKIVLNIPQSRDWPWISTLRIFSALLCKRATVSLGALEEARISTCCRQLDPGSTDWMHRLKEYVNNANSEYEKAAMQYSQMAEQYLRENAFPYEIFECWGMLDQAQKPRTLKPAGGPVKAFYRSARSSTSPQLLEEGYLGFNLVGFQGKVFAVRQSIGPIDIHIADLEPLKAAKNCFVGESVDLVKEEVRLVSMGKT
jgi:hypothetical protein